MMLRVYSGGYASHERYRQILAVGAYVQCGLCGAVLILNTSVKRSAKNSESYAPP